MARQGTGFISQWLSSNYRLRTFSTLVFVDPSLEQKNAGVHEFKQRSLITNPLFPVPLKAISLKIELDSKFLWERNWG
ncbi:MAG TPA: hypothetical protein DDZ80_09030 [Cyanobacteria bacterium UBA8803]|nr:hypothetical protein [Cyanobacteria bacterium UBA9273]HBL58641.1 hypothetical protein [Cyanobacteria bacterium UBA8803]